jgi:crotonobetainyl-CoA:carnitine CoA-transferase CaiB-like acyl-CoA transferase
MPPGAAIADHTGSMQLALGIMTALYAREQTGLGQEVNTSSLGALMWIQAWEITHTTMSDETLRREGQHNPNIRCPYGIYETKDGGAFLLAVAMSEESWDEFWLFVDRPEVVLDTRWNTAAKRIGARGVTDGVDEIRQIVREAFASRTTAEWTEFLATQPEIIYERIQNYDELVEDPQVAANGYLVDVDVPKFGPARVVSNVVHLSATPGAGVRRPPPLLGEHTAEVMEELGFGGDEIDEVLASAVGAADLIIAAIYDDD